MDVLLAKALYAQLLHHTPVTQGQINGMQHPYYWDGKLVLAGDRVVYVALGDYSNRLKLNLDEVESGFDYPFLKSLEGTGFLSSFKKVQPSAQYLHHLCEKELARLEDQYFFEYDRYTNEVCLILYNFDYAPYVEEGLKRIGALYDLPLAVEKKHDTIPLVIYYSILLISEAHEQRVLGQIVQHVAREVEELKSKGKIKLKTPV